MPERTASTSPLRLALTAGGAAALGSCLAVVLSAPALTRPPVAAFFFLVAVPGVLGAAAYVVLGWLPGLRRRHAARTAAAGLLAALPWLGVAAAPMARSPLAALLAAAVLAVAAGLVAGRGWPALAALGLLAHALLVWPRLGVLDLDGQRSVVILGLDGATWEQIDPMIEAGELAHFRALREGGAAGVLYSKPPIASPSAWTTIATGVSPEVHGIAGFGVRRTALAAGRIWDEVTTRGGSAGIVGWLVNWPPDPGLSFSVPGWLTTGLLAEPPEASFVKRMEHTMDEGGDPFDAPPPAARRAAGSAKRGSQAGDGSGRSFSASLVADGLSALAVSSADDAWRLLADAALVAARRPPKDMEWRLRLLRARLQTGLYLELLARYRPQASALVTYPTDGLAHRYWRYHQPEHFSSVTPEQIARYGEVVREAYRTADRALGKILARIDPDRTTVIVVSDHGMATVPEGERNELRIREIALLRVIGLENELNAAVAMLDDQVIVTSKRGGVEGDAALAHARELLSSAVNEDHPEPPFAVTAPEGFSRVLFVRLARHGMPLSERIRIGGRTITVEELCKQKRSSVDHSPRGFLLVAGPGVQPGATVDADQVDVAPTALYAMGRAVPEGLEGRVPEELYRRDWWASRPPRLRPGAMAPPSEPGEVPVDEEILRRRLKALGYLQ